jgi:hypothetical protein
MLNACLFATKRFLVAYAEALLQSHYIVVEYAYGATETIRSYRLGNLPAGYACFFKHTIRNKSSTYLYVNKVL